MSEQHEGDICPEFDQWGINEVKKSATQAFLRSLRRSGVRGIAILSAVIGLVWMAGHLLDSPMEGGLKSLCTLGIAAALLAIAVVALLTEKKHHATADKKGRDSQAQHGVEYDDEGSAGPAARLNGRAFDG